ncbi:MAG: hypothetical protein J2P54_01080 [Bradyrhizobiaceae bacterium]|nr:hypothetical protein [Bradyrhizobiaceae bacterium]
MLARWRAEIAAGIEAGRLGRAGAEVILMSHNAAPDAAPPLRQGSRKSKAARHYESNSIIKPNFTHFADKLLIFL